MSITNQNQPEGRKFYWDNIKGLLIVLVVFAHCLYGLQNRQWNNMVFDAIYYFHMPAFAFVSGFFSKSERSRSKEALLKFLFAYLFMMAVWVFYDVYKGNTPKLLTPYKSAWYLLALIIWRLVTPGLSKIKWIVPLTVLFALVAGYWPDVGGNNTLAIKKAVVFYPFFITGFLITENKCEGIRSLPWKKRIIWGSVLLALIIAGELVSHKLLNITDHELLPNKYLSGGMREPLARMSIFAVSSAFILAALLLSPESKVFLLNKAGKNSLAIFVIHRPLTWLFVKAFKHIGTWQQNALAIVCTLGIVLVFGSDCVSNKVNCFLKHCVDAVLLHNKRKYLGNRIVLFVFLAAIFLSPVIMKIVK